MNVFQEFALTIFFAALAAVLLEICARRYGIAKSNIRTKVSRRAGNVIFALLCLVYIAIFGSLAVLRHASFHSGGFDLGIFDQVIWNSLRGRLFETSIRIDANSFLAQHFSSLLIAIVPFYAIWSDPRTLLIVQTVCLAISALPVYWFARQQMGVPIALGIAAAYYMFPSLQFVTLFEFHEIALATPLLSFATFFLLRRRYVPFLVSLFLALLVKEEIAFIVIGLGFYLFFAQQSRGLGLVLGLFGMAYALVVFTYIIPLFLDNSYDANYFVMDRYAYLGKTIPEIAITLITRPGLVIQHLMVAPKIEFILQLIIPLVFIPLAGGEILALTIPSLGYLLVGDYAYQNSIHYQYTAPIIPFIFFALVLGWKRISMLRIPNRINATGARFPAPFFLPSLVLTASLANYYLQAPGPLAIGFEPGLYTMDGRVALGNDLLSQISPAAVTMAEANLVPHLSERQFIYQSPQAPNLRLVEYLFADTRFGPHQEYKSILDDVLSSPFFETLADQDGYLLRKRGLFTPEHQLAIAFGRRLTLTGYTVESQLPIKRGENLSFVLVWRADQDIHERYVVFAHLIDAEDRIVTQGDREPANGWLRTNLWRAGDTTPDRYILELDESLLPGDYEIVVGLYNPLTGERLATGDGKDQTIISSIPIQ
jgi:uncharacterized membrane protein